MKSKVKFWPTIFIAVVGFDVYLNSLLNKINNNIVKLKMDFVPQIMKPYKLKLVFENNMYVNM